MAADQPGRTGSPWIRNTSRHLDDEVRQLVQFATQGVDMSRVCVNVKGGHGLSARAYDGVPSISNAPRRARYLVTIKIGNGVRFPVGPHNRNGKGPRRGRTTQPVSVLHLRRLARVAGLRGCP